MELIKVWPKISGGRVLLKGLRKWALKLSRVCQGTRTTLKEKILMRHLWMTFRLVRINSGLLTRTSLSLSTHRMSLPTWGILMAIILRTFKNLLIQPLKRILRQSARLEKVWVRVDLSSSFLMTMSFLSKQWLRVTSMPSRNYSSTILSTLILRKSHCLQEFMESTRFKWTTKIQSTSSWWDLV